ncbi:MAG: ATP-dependent DNA helicase RecG, partial [Synechococcaceae bacterium WB7_3xG_012]|nr:ATP-dependent DNA helicase RecG [Synechococcaceae bacterium WB7_3xG_012]
MVHPEYRVVDSPDAVPVEASLTPVYPTTEGIGQSRWRDLTGQALDRCADAIPELLGDWAGFEFSDLSLADALRFLHRPPSGVDLDALKSGTHPAQQRLAFEELLANHLALRRRRERRDALSARAILPSTELWPRLRESLGFSLTDAQTRSIEEVMKDLAKVQPALRLVQGDVGSGKTVVAIAALLTAIDSGCQGALMAPTEVLAEQHYRKLCEWLPQLHVTCALLTGSTPLRRRRELLADLANGTLKMLVGTHALLEDPVQFQRLGLVVVDEQHRFGVHQRNRLLDKGLQPHLLTMTATPIPRTLALSIHGDLEVSQIDELPPGRTPIRTSLLASADRDEAYSLIREQVALGQRAYVVLPLVEESEKLDLRSAVDVHQQLSEQVFPNLQVGLLHGRMPSAEKQAAITAFASGETQVLVSTTVVEVGVDVPEASVMVIDHADRFGLAQLHQLRGRVGRGAAASYCLLVNDSRNVLARQRLEVLVRSNDGFEIAEMDLRLRGPGQVLGTRQSGLPDLALASLTDDGEVLEQARRVAQEIVAEDPDLDQHPGLAKVLSDQRHRVAQAARLN